MSFEYHADDGSEAFSEARQTALAVARFWHKHGYPFVEAWPSRKPYGNGQFAWSVDSNLFNGLPPGATPGEVSKIYRF